MTLKLITVIVMAFFAGTIFGVQIMSGRLNFMGILVIILLFVNIFLALRQNN